MQNPALLFQFLNALVVKYRALRFEDWQRRFIAGEKLHDCSDSDQASERWWQADTDVLEIESDEDDRQYALVAITLYPSGVHSSPPAPSASLKIYEDGTVFGKWAEGSDFTWRQPARE